MEEKDPNFQKRVIRFLKALSVETEGSSQNYHLSSLESHLGFTNEDTKKIQAYLYGNGFVKYPLSGYISITQPGKELIKSIPPEDLLLDESPTSKKYNVFISHISENEPVARKLQEYLKAVFADEIDVFVSGDPHSIPAGQDWFTTIIDGIRKCNCMIILCSPQSVERKWIHFEAGAATVLDRKIILLCFAGLGPGKLPSPLDHIRKQAIDSDDAEKLQQHFKILTTEIAVHANIKGSILDVLQSDFYQKLQQVHPKNQPPKNLPGNVL